MSKLWRFFWYAGADPEDYKRVEDEIWKTNRSNVLTYCVIMLFVLTALCFTAQRTPEYYTFEHQIFYAGAALCCAVLIFLLTFLPRKKIFVAPVVFMTFIASYFATTYSSCFITPNVPAVTFIVLLVMTPWLVSGRPLLLYMTILCGVCIFLHFNLLYCSEEVLYSNMVNVIVFSIVSIFMASVSMKTAVRRYITEYNLRYLGDVDLLTGVNNRNLFERNMARYTRISKEQLNCVYVDVNGLHELNNSMGHATGDDVLRRVADELKQFFRQSDIYRIGGDEFVVFIADKPLYEVLDRMDACRKNLLDISIFISYGVRNMDKKELDIENIVKDAEGKMFRAKEEFYNSRGMVHR